MLLYASNRRLEGWGSLDVGGRVELVIWRSVSSLETAPMWVSPTQVVKSEGGPAASLKPGQKSCVRSSGIIKLFARRHSGG